MRKQVSDRIIADNSKADSSPPSPTYPVSVYDTNVRAHEKFTESVRKRNDTFYYISFRRVSAAESVLAELFMFSSVFHAAIYFARIT